MQELKEFQILKRQMSQTDPAIINSVNYSTFNGSISGLIKFSKNLYINGQQDTDFFNIHSAFQQILQSSVNSLQTFPKDFNTLLITKRQRDIDTLDKNARQAIANYISNLEFYGVYSGALDDLTRRHNTVMESQDMPFLAIRANELTSEFDMKKNLNSPLHTSVVKSLFWTNKFVKYVKSSLPAMLLFESDQEKYTHINYSVRDKVSDDDKYIAICKSNFFDKIFKLFSSSVLPPNVNFANLLIYFESLENPQTFEEDPQLKKKLDDQPTPPDSAIELLKQISDSYNDLFADITPKTRFIDDAFCSNGVLSTTAFLYKVKDELTKALLNLLLIDKDKASKRFPHSGILYDDGVPILNAEVEGHIGIVSVHIPLFLQNEPGMKEALASLKNYSSAIKKSHILVPATQEQKKQLKAAVSNVASLNNPEKRAILTQYLGMATGNYYEFYKAMNNDKTK